MKYYHIIYNSSERPMDGGVGFGIRTATEGTPESLLKLIKDIKFFTDDWDTYENKPTPSQVKDNPSAIECIPKNYAVTNLTDEHGQAYFVVARRAYVGFDYGFYKNGMPTRLGNYVIDYYVFDTAPNRSVYEILYEDALPGSNHFIPKSVLPAMTNEEMVLISVGSQAPLVVEDKPFSANLQDSLDENVVKLFFYYLQAKKDGQKLLVKVNREISVKLMADFYRMLPPILSAQIRIYLNLRTQGTNDNFDIYFIHEDYPHQIYTGLYSYVELETSGMPQSHEATNFAKRLASYVCSSFENNKDDVDDLLKWLNMPEYDKVRNMSKETNNAFFSYCIQPDNFTYDGSLKLSTGGLNRELLELLGSYTKQNPNKIERLKLVVKDTMNEANPETVVGLIKDFNELERVGFDFEEIIKDVNKHVCSVFLSDIKLFKKLLDEVHYENITKFFVEELFAEKKNYLSQNDLDKYLPKLYKWFLTNSYVEKHPNSSLARFFVRDCSIDKTIMCLLVDDVFKDVQGKINFFVMVHKNKYVPFNTMWDYLKYYLEGTSYKVNFFEKFEDQKNEDIYAPMFYFTLKSFKDEICSSDDRIIQLKELLSQNAALKKLVKDNFSIDNIYEAAYHYIDNNCTKIPHKCSQLIKDDIVEFLDVKETKWIVLASYIDLLIDADNKPYNENDSKDIILQGIYEKIVDHNNAELFDTLKDDFIELARKGKLGIKSLAETYKKFNANESCTVTLSNLRACNNWIEMAGVVILEIFGNTFIEAMNIMDQLEYSASDKESFYMCYYEKDYNAYKRKNKINKFFKSITSFFSSKKEEKEKKYEKREGIRFGNGKQYKK